MHPDAKGSRRRRNPRSRRAPHPGTSRQGDDATMTTTKTVQQPFVHESSYLDDGAKVGAGTKIWHFSHVMSGAEIGRDCSIGQNVLVARDVKVGHRVKIQN